MTITHRVRYKSEIGLIELTATASAITSLNFVEPESAAAGDDAIASDLLRRAIAQLDEYFRGQRQEFSLPLAPDGTGFQQRVWQQLGSIPYGKTVSYLEIAAALGNAQAVRAVGMANGRNPISIIIPCHRVIGSNGQLTGYGGGLWRKKWLLAHEGWQRHPHQLSLF